MLTESLINQLYTQDKEKVINILWRIRNNLSSEMTRNMMQAEDLEDLWMDGLQILQKKFLSSQEMEYTDALKLLVGILKLEFKIVLHKKVRESYWLAGRQQWEQYLFNERAYKRKIYNKWASNHPGRVNELARQSYRRNKPKWTAERRAKKKAYRKLWSQKQRAKYHLTHLSHHDTMVPVSLNKGTHMSQIEYLRDLLGDQETQRALENHIKGRLNKGEYTARMKNLSTSPKQLEASPRLGKKMQGWTEEERVEMLTKAEVLFAESHNWATVARELAKTSAKGRSVSSLYNFIYNSGITKKYATPQE